MINLARAPLQVRPRLFTRSREQCEHASQSLTAARSEYSKALQAVVRREVEFSTMHMKQHATVFHSQRLWQGQFHATGFATEYFWYETTRCCCIWAGFS